MNERNRREYYMGQEISHKGDSGTIANLRILEIISMPCPPRNRVMFQDGKVFLCYFKNLPFETEEGTMSTISGYAIVDEPFEKLRDWTESPLEKNNDGWDDTNLFNETPEEAIETKIKDLKEIWCWTSLKTSCQSCMSKGEECRKQLTQLLASNKTSFSFSPFSSPIAPSAHMSWKKPSSKCY